MDPTVRSYGHKRDFDAVSEFLVRTYRTTGDHINWLQPRWEYMVYHPLVREVDLSSVGVFERGGRIVGIVHPEHEMGVAYCEFDEDHRDLVGAMFDHAERRIAAEHDGRRRLRVFIHHRDRELADLARSRGYERTEGGEAMSRFEIDRAWFGIALPDGFRLTSLAEDNDLTKLDRVLWRGFGHGDEPTADGLADRQFMQSAPNYQLDLNVVVVAPSGQFVSYCGMWYEPAHRIAYVEPVATDPDYRRMGLGRAAVLEGIRRCGERGATVAYVGTTMPFYLSFGFEPMYEISLWQRTWA